MKNIENHNEWNELLKGKHSLEKKIDQLHAEELGLGVPVGYFEKSKNDIFEKAFPKKKSRLIPLFKSKVTWFAAAGIALIVALSVFSPNTNSTINDVPSAIADTVRQIRKTDLPDNEFFMKDDILVASLFIDDSEIDMYFDNYIIEETIIDEYIDHFLLDDLTGETMVLY